MLAALVLSAWLQEPTTPRALGWEDFPVFVWRETYQGKPLPAELARPFGGVILMRDEGSVWARERGLAYLVWNVAGRAPLHLDADEAWKTRVERWIETHDEALLVREPCWNDPQTLAEMQATFVATMKRHAQFPGLGFVLGDEVSLTPNGDPFDLCRCGFCEAKWRAYAGQRNLPERAPLTDEVLAQLRADDFASLGAWLARRRFEQDRAVQLIQELARRAGRDRGWSDVNAEVGLLGCKGQTAFGGVALERVVNDLDLIECYALDSARELAATAPGLWRHGLDGSTGPDPGPRLRLDTLFLEQAEPAELAWSLYNAWLRGATGLVLWSDTTLARLSAEARSRLTDALATVRAATVSQGKNSHRLTFRPEPGRGGVAVVRDADSTALSFLRDALEDGATWPRRKASYQQEHGTLERKVVTWMRLLEDCGLEPAAIELGSVCADCSVHGLGVLVLPEVLVLGDHDILRLSTYVERGGWLVVDGTLGWVDRDGRPRADVRERIAGQHPERIVDAPALGDYLAERLDPAAVEELRRFVLDLGPVFRERLSSWAEVRPLFRGAAAHIPWLVRSSELEPATPGYTLLPNLESVPERRRALRDVPLDDIVAPEGYRLEWILPPDGKVLRAGDVARLRLRPAGSATPPKR